MLSVLRVCVADVGKMWLLMQMLISVANCQVNAVDSDQTTPLAMAAMYGKASACESLVSSSSCTGSIFLYSVIDYQLYK